MGKGVVMTVLASNGIQFFAYTQEKYPPVQPFYYSLQMVTMTKAEWRRHTLAQRLSYTARQVRANVCMIFYSF